MPRNGRQRGAGPISGRRGTDAQRRGSFRSTTFQRRDFVEDARGVVRVLPPLTHKLTAAMPSFGAAIGPVLEHIANQFAEASPYDVSTPSVLTRTKHRAAAGRRVDGSEAPRPAVTHGPGTVGLAPRRKRRHKPPISSEPPLPLPICRQCGSVLAIEPERTKPGGSYCSTCLSERRAEAGSAMQPASLKDARDFAKATGTRPTHTPEARAARQNANRAQRAEQAGWDAEHAGEVHDLAWFTSVALPGLAKVTLPAIAKATGMSTSAAAKVRSGRRVPHPRHWEALAELAGIELPVEHS